MVVINNSSIANYAMFKLDKLDNVFTEEELDTITDMVIDFKNETDSSFVFFDELLKLPKINNLTIRNGYISNDFYEVLLELHKLSNVVFDNCELENADLIISLNLDSLSLINTDVNNYHFINTFIKLKELTIINGNIDLKNISNLRDLEYLQLSYSNVIGEINNTNIRELYIDNTNIVDLDFINKLDKLERLSIDSNQYENNKELVNILIKKGIMVLNENMIEFGGVSNGIRL